MSGLDVRQAVTLIEAIRYKNSETVFCGKEKYESKFLLCKAWFFYVGKRNWTNGCIKILKKFYIKHTQKRAF